jgi:hypothetical protein
MNSALDEFADNPIIEELNFLRTHFKKIKSLRASSTLWRKAFIEIDHDGGKVDHLKFEREGFIRDWAEATVILQTLTDIKCMAEFDYKPPADKDALVDKVLQARDKCIEECQTMFDSGLYQVYFNQFGYNCKDLPSEAKANLDEARQKINGEKS